MHQTASRLARNVYEILSKLPRHGVGSKLSRKTWQDNSFWTVTEVKTETTGKNGKAYGILTWRGQEQGQSPVRINGSNKKVWRHVPRTSGVQSGWPSLALTALKCEEAESSEIAAKEDPQPPSDAEENTNPVQKHGA